MFTSDVHCRKAARQIPKLTCVFGSIAGEDGSLTFVWPSRFQPKPAPGDHTMKEACWKVLADLAKNEDDIATAAKGLPVREIARQIETQRLRVTKSSTIVEGSVAGALSRDSLFAYVAPGTYALQVCFALFPETEVMCPCVVRSTHETCAAVAWWVSSQQCCAFSHE